jgi:hypothetical protein
MKLTSLSILDVESGDLFVDEWGRINVRVRGTGKASLTVEGDIDCLNPGSVKLTAKSVIIGIPIKPKRKGELPIKIAIKTSEEDSKIAWLKVEERIHKCPSCGAPVEPGAKYCWKCGAKLS